ncbi:MAG: sulfite exporter TauE/SafE family protein [Acidimicrobiales bacterium]
MLITLAVLAAGFGSGVLASVLGVGGAVITTPMIRVLGATPIAAVGSTVPAILPGALSGSLRYHREGYILWPVARTCGLSGMAFAVVGGIVADVVDARWLMILTAILVMWCGASLWRDGVRTNAIERAAERSTAGGAEDEVAADPGPIHPRGGLVGMVALGVGAGFLAGLLGIGGGLLLTPGLTLGLRLPVKHAIATSLAAVAMMSTTAVVTHIVLGHVNWRFAIPLALGIVPGARVGAHLTVGASERRMRLVAGILLVAVSLVYLGGEIAAL